MHLVGYAGTFCYQSGHQGSTAHRRIVTNKRCIGSANPTWLQQCTSGTFYSHRSQLPIADRTSSVCLATLPQALSNVSPTQPSTIAKELSAFSAGWSRHRHLQDRRSNNQVQATAPCFRSPLHAEPMALHQGDGATTGPVPLRQQHHGLHRTVRRLPSLSR